MGFNSFRILRSGMERWVGIQIDLKWHELNSSQGRKDKNPKQGLHHQDPTIQTIGTFMDTVGITSVMVNFMR